MKLTWFGGTTVRLHIAGKILVADADPALGLGLVSGADTVFGLAGGPVELPWLDPTSWRPRAVPRPLEENQHPGPGLYRIGDAAVLVDAPGVSPVALVAGAQPAPFGRWADGAVVTLFGAAPDLILAAGGLLAAARPRLIALAPTETDVDEVIAAVRGRLDGSALVSLEPGLPLEA